MLLFLFSAALLYELCLASAAGEDDSTVGWVSDPNGRGTLSLIISCVVTFTLCVWSALHVNVPVHGSTHRDLALEKAKVRGLAFARLQFDTFVRL